MGKKGGRRDCRRHIAIFYRKISRRHRGSGRGRSIRFEGGGVPLASPVERRRRSSCWLATPWCTKQEKPRRKGVRGERSEHAVVLKDVAIRRNQIEKILGAEGFPDKNTNGPRWSSGSESQDGLA